MKTSSNEQKHPYAQHYNNSLSVTQSDIQYQLWSNLMKKASDTLIEKQLRVMAQSAQLIDLYNEQILNRKHQDENTTRDQTQALLSGYFNFDKQAPNKFKRTSQFKMSLSNDNLLLLSRSGNRRNQFNSPNDRVLYRRSPLANHQSFNFVFAKQLKDIEQNCRSKTYKSIKLLVDDLKKLKNYFTEYEANEKRIMRNLEMLEKEHEDYLILKKMNEENEKKVEQLNKQIEESKSKIKKMAAERQAEKQVKNFQFLGLKQANVGHLASFLEKKQRNITNKLNKVLQVEKNTINMIENAFQVKMKERSQQFCEKCCDFFKKAKNSLLKLRESLMEESQEMERLYNDYRGVMLQDISQIYKKYGSGPRSIKSLSIKSQNPKVKAFLKLKTKQNPESQLL